MKKTLRAVLAILMVAVLLAGCGSSGGSSKKSKKNNSKDKVGFLGQLADSLTENGEQENEKENNKRPLWGGAEEQVETTAPIEEEVVMPTEPETEAVTLKVWAPAEDLEYYGWIE